MVLRNRFGEFRALLPILVLILAAAGCSKKPKPVVTPPPEPPPVTETETPPPVETPPEPPKVEITFTDVFFDFDKSNIRTDQQAAMERNARTLAENTDVTILLEGHCDERGTVEYNLALGQRRAESVKKYLVQYGIDAGRVSTISYGEERPFSVGHTEDAWSQNRRAHFVRQ